MNTTLTITSLVDSTHEIRATFSEPIGGGELWLDNNFYGTENVLNDEGEVIGLVTTLTNLPQEEVDRLTENAFVEVWAKIKTRMETNIPGTDT